jgi:hypothetical protein
MQRERESVCERERERKVTVLRCFFCFFAFLFFLAVGFGWSEHGRGGIDWAGLGWVRRVGMEWDGMGWDLE